MSKFKYALAAVFATLLASALPAWAEEYTWRTDVEEGNFTDVSNWSPTPSTTDTGTFVIGSGHVNLNTDTFNYQNVIVNGGELTRLSDLDFYEYASLTLNGGVFTVVSSDLTLHVNASITLSGGTINLESIYGTPIGLGYIYGGYVTITDGTINAPSGFTFKDANLIMSGGTINIGVDALFSPSSRSQIHGGTLGTCGDNTGWIGDSNFMKYVEAGCALTFAPESGKTIELSESQTGSGNLILDGAGTLLLSEGPGYTGSTTINNGTLQLGADSTLYNLSGGTENTPVTLYASDGTSGYNLTINTSGDEAKKYVGSITAANITVNATDDAPFQVYTAANGAVRAESFVVSSGRVDVKGCMEGAVEVQSDATFSPGNSVGHVDIDGEFTLNGGTLLIEMDETGIDTMTADSFDLDNGTISFTLTDDIPWGASYDILTATGGAAFDDSIIDRILNGQTLPDYFSLTIAGDANNIVRFSIDRNAVPEPSTWALMILGAAGLLYVRKQTRK